MAEDNIDKALPNEPRKTFEVPGDDLYYQDYSDYD